MVVEVLQLSPSLVMSSIKSSAVSRSPLRGKFGNAYSRLNLLSFFFRFRLKKSSFLNCVTNTKGVLSDEKIQKI